MFSYTTLYYDDQPVSGRALDLWIPPSGAIRPLTLCFVHGGGWQHGRRDQMHAIMHGFFQAGYVCVSVDYRLGGARVPDQVSDVREGMALADACLRERGIEHPFALYGSSAGGHLALLAGLAPQGACGDLFGGAVPPVAGIAAASAPVTFEPWDDVFPESWNAMREAVGVGYDEDPEKYRRVSPVHYATSDTPLLFLLGECEHMFPNALTISLVQRLQAQGGRADCVIYPAAEHGFFYDLQRRNQKMAFQDLLAFFDRLAAPQVLHQKVAA